MMIVMFITMILLAIISLLLFPNKVPFSVSFVLLVLGVIGAILFHSTEGQ